MSSPVTQAPSLSPDQAASAARELYGLQGEIKELPSERDQNFHLRLDTGEEYVLKVANSTEQEKVLDFQNKAMAHIRAMAGGRTVCPRVIPDLEGREITSRQVGGKTHFIRVLTYLPGRPLALVRPHGQELMTGLGRFYGLLDQALEDFDHPALHREFHWDLARAGEVVERHLPEIPDPNGRGLVQGFLVGYQERTLPLVGGLARQAIHNDGNDYNIIVAPQGRWSLEVSGVIDFGDMVFSQRVNDPAITCAYAMLGKKDPLGAASWIIGGYHRARPLSEEELAALFDLICMRLCTSVCHSAHQARLNPGNNYLRISEQQAWELLAKLDQVHPNLALYRFRQACGLEPVPGGGRIEAWLRANQGSFSPVIQADLGDPNLPVLDLGVDSPLLASIDDPQEIAAAIAATVARSKTRGGPGAALGRYGEPRPIYTEDYFKADSEELPEQRTIHLGLDLFVEPGTPVRAFMEGRVHSFNDNAAPLDYGPAVILEHRTGEGDVFYSLYGHLSRETLEGLAKGQGISRGETFAHVGRSEVNGGWTPHLHFQIVLDLLGEEGTFPGVAAPSQEAVQRALSPDPSAVLGLGDIPDPGGRSIKEILELRRNSFGTNLSISYRQPLKIVRGRGQYLYSHTGQRYLDMVNNVCHVGHCHPRVVAAGQRQMAVLNTNTRYLHDNIVNFGQALLSKFPKPLEVCFFVCSGSEANELALRLCRTCTDQRDLITVDGAYHGNTQALIEISPYKHDGPGGKGAPQWVKTVAMPDGYRGAHKGQGRETGQAYARDVLRAVEEIKAQGRGPAAFICEPMLGCGGQVVLPDGYMRAAFEHVRQAGGLCIADEVQVGFGRAGVKFWAFETQEVIPDVVTLGKPIGNGHPLAAVVTTREIARTFANGMEYFNTFGGNPVSCAIGSAVLEVIEEEGLQENARRMGERLLAGLEELKSRYELIGDVRGLGLYIGAELVRDQETLEPAAQEADYIINRAKEFGILLSTDGPLHNVLKMKPPLVLNQEDVDYVLQVLDTIFREDRLRG